MKYKNLQTNSIDFNLKNVYKHFFLIGIILTIFLLVSLYVYKFSVVPFMHTKHTNVNYSMPKALVSEFIPNHENENIGALKQSDHIEQTFRSNDDVITELFINFYNPDADKQGQVQVDLVDLLSNATVCHKILQIQDISNNGTTLSLDVPLENIQNREFALKIDILGLEPDANFSIVKSKGYIGDYPNENLLTINQNPCDYKMCFKVMSYENTFIKPVFLFLVFIFSVLIMGLYYLLFIRKAELKIETVFLICVISLGLIYMFVLPPFSVPDEGTHVGSAYRYSNKLFGIAFGTEANLFARYTDFAPNPMFKTPNIDTYHYVLNNLFTVSNNGNIREIILHGEETPYAGVVFEYLFSTLGFTFARILHLGFLPMLIMGRMFNFVFFVTLMYVVIKRLPFGKIIFFSVCLLPCTMQFAISVSRDCIVNTLAFYVIGTVIYLAYSDKEIMWWDILCLWISTGLLVTCKSGIYFLICFSVLLIPRKKFRSKRTYFITLLLIFLSCALIFTFCNMAGVQEASTQNNLERYSISYIFDYPKNFIKIFIENIKDKLYDYIFTMIGANLGWLHIDLPFYIPFIYLFVIILSAFKPKEELIYISNKAKLFFGFISITTFCMFCIVAFTWTERAFQTIQGLQGRYLIPLLPIALFLLRNNNLTYFKPIDKQLIYTIFLLNSITIISILELILGQKVSMVIF